MGNESVHKKLIRLRPPRVRLTYEVETYDGALEIRELPFVVGLLGDLSGQHKQRARRLKDRKFIEVNDDNFDAVIEVMRPRLTLSVKNTLTSTPDVPNLNVELDFMRMKDFEPRSVIAQVKPLRELLDLRMSLSELRGSLQTNEKLGQLLLEVAGNTEKLQRLKGELELRETERAKRLTPTPDREREPSAIRSGEQDWENGLLDHIIEEGWRGADAAKKLRGELLVKEFIKLVLEGTTSADCANAQAALSEAMIETRIAQIDHVLSLQLDEILHDPRFQRLEATWRGLKYLVDHTSTSSTLKIKVLHATKSELFDDLLGAPEFDQSSIFTKVYGDVFGTFRGEEPFGALIGDYEFGRSPDDVELLEKISQAAASAHAVFIAAASPGLLGLEAFTQLDRPRYLGSLLDASENAHWKSFRQSENSRYVALTLPRVLMRLPYSRETQPCEEFDYEEGVDDIHHSKYLWGNAAYTLGTRLTNAFALYGWCAAIRGVEGGGLVEDLPIHTFCTDEGNVTLKSPTEVLITDRQEKELADLGFVPLIHCKGTDNAAFFSVQSCQKPKIYDSEDATANARLSRQLPYVLAASRVAHYLKVLIRDFVGSFMSREDLEQFLNRWIAQYVTSDDVPSEDTKAKYPLRDATVQVTEAPGKPGIFRAIVFLRPHFQLDELTASLSLVVELPTAKAQAERAARENADQGRLGRQRAEVEQATAAAAEEAEQEEASPAEILGALPPTPEARQGAEAAPLAAEQEGPKVAPRSSPVFELPRQSMVIQIGKKLRTAKRRSAVIVRNLRSSKAAAADPVDCTLFGPPRVTRGETFLMQVFAHRPEQAATTMKLAKQFDQTAEKRGFQSLETEIRRGSKLGFRLLLPGLEVDEPVQQITWRGTPQSLQFGVKVPPEFASGNVIGTVTVDQDSVPVGHIKFKLAVAQAPTATEPMVLGDSTRRYQKAFVSYASQDRDEVLKRVQMLKALRVGFFHDVLNLEPGERWEKALYRHIDESDLFLLFWSTAARQSKWVLQEVHYALKRKGGDEFAPPEILPVPIEGPPPVLPPKELADLHFNDPLLYFMTKPRNPS